MAAGLSLLLTRWVDTLSRNTQFDLFQGAVVLSAWYGGFGPGILTGVLSILALDYFFIPPLYNLGLGLTDLFRLAIFGAVALLTSSLSDRLKQAKADLERSSQELEIRVHKRTQELSISNRELIGEIVARVAAEKTILDISNREQQRLGEDLHDGLCQQLAAIKLLSEDVKEKLEARAAPEAKEAGLIESRVSEALAQADNISRGLYPVELETNGLMAALQEMAVRISRIYPVACRFECPKPVLIRNVTMATHLYRIAQEAVINAIKGGKAKRIIIRLRPLGYQGVLSVADDGIGFKASSGRRGMGLKIMEYRARMILAPLKIRSGTKLGTVVRCQFRMEDKMLAPGNDFTSNV